MEPQFFPCAAHVVGTHPHAPPTLGWQVPVPPHAMHVGHDAVPQHTPSTQNPLAQLLPDVHAAPRGLRPQTLPLQLAGATQPLLDVQLLAQTPEAEHR
jgi:hypothetical protein